MASNRISDYLISKVKKENKLILKSAFSYLTNEEVDIQSILNIGKNSKDEIVKVDFDVAGATRILSKITEYMNENLEEYNFLGYKLEIPFGIVSRSPFLMNLGPKIPIKIELADIALGNVKTKIREYGINNVLLEVYLEVSITTQIIYPLKITEEHSSYEALIASTAIQGIVPDFYNGTINSKSDLINLPLN